MQIAKQTWKIRNIRNITDKILQQENMTEEIFQPVRAFSLVLLFRRMRTYNYIAIAL